MAVTETVGKVKILLDLSKGSQTISNCQLEATADQLYEIAEAVGDLHQEKVDKNKPIERSKHYGRTTKSDW